LTYRVDIDSIHASLFLLENMVFASENLCSKYSVSTDTEEGSENYYRYFGWLRFILSEQLISVAIKTRVVMDVLASEERIYHEDGEEFGPNVFNLVREVSTRYNLGNFDSPEEELDIRLVCNKILHAEDIFPIQETSPTKSATPFDESTDGAIANYDYWTGVLNLSGHHRGNEWSLNLNVAEFCSALEEFISRIEAEFDLYRIYKHDI